MGLALCFTSYYQKRVATVMLVAIDIAEEGVLPAINITNKVIFKRKYVMWEEKCKE